MLYNTLHKFKVSHILGRNLLTERFFLFRVLYKGIQRLSFNHKVTRNGQALIIPIRKGVGFMNLISQYESWMDEILPKVVADHEADFIDVGANVGQTMLKVLPTLRTNRYLAIEPNPSCAAYLQDLVEINTFRGVEIVQVALADEEGQTSLLRRFEDDILATTTPSFRKYTKYSSTSSVQQVTGDYLVRQIRPQKISAIKIDVEGGELKVLKGFSKSIRTYQPYLILEILPIQSKDATVGVFRSENAREIISLINSLEYQLYNIQYKVQINRIEDLSNSLESSNYLATPKGRSIAL